MQLIHKEEFTTLFQEFVNTFVHTSEGQEYIGFYKRDAHNGQFNFLSIEEAFEAEEITNSDAMTEELTDRVLNQLLPHSNTPQNQLDNCWIHRAPAIQGNIREWYESQGYKPDWRKVAHGIFHFIKACIENKNSNLQAICKNFFSLQYIKGFQSEMLSPILNALSSENFLLVNDRSQKTINYFANNRKDSSDLVDYPSVNVVGKGLIASLAPAMQEIWGSSLSAADQFDMFCHWLVSIKKFDLKSSPVNFWKIAPGENAWQWEDCLSKGFIAIGWDELGDISGFTKEDFNELRDELINIYPDWKKAGVNQVWAFSQINVGDRIVANRGTREVIGIGTVIGGYYYQADAEQHKHRLSIRWDDTEPRAVYKPSWVKTLIALDSSAFSIIQKLYDSPEVEKVNSACPFGSTTFDLLSKLHTTPKKAIYDEYKQEFNNHLKEPFQRLMLEVATHLPAPITDLMEIRNGIFGRILKNDFGRGGAYERYWGAFYPKGVKKTEGAQLILSIGYDRLNFGFDIGHYSGEQRERFLENCRKHYESLCELLEAPLNQPHLLFGDRGNVKFDSDGNPVNPDQLSFQDWLSQVSSKGVHVFTTLSKARVLSSSRDELVNDIGRVFSQLFPLVLLATLDDPMPSLQEYLELGGEDDESVIESNETYTLSQCANDTHLEASLLEDWVKALNHKRQAILYGPPGTGKTYLAEHLAKHLLSDSDGFTEIVQFHPAYTYEDFIQGIRPKQGKNGGLDYPVEPGRFLNFCQEARQRQSICVLIIDEINRANLAQVFGELMYLLEYRDKEVNLACGGQRFSIPKNVRIIGTMNTADRSIALVDHALRRRFAFLPLYPQMDVLRHFHAKTSCYVGGLISVLERVNKTIDDPQYAIGTSFFLHESLQTELRAIWRMEIEPYLEEYFFDQPQKVEEFRWERVKSELMP